MVDGWGWRTPGTVTLQAIPRPGALFSHWSNEEGILSHDHTLILVVTQGCNVTAHFKEALTIENLTPGAAIIKDGGGPVQAGDICTVTAEITNRWYAFSGWHVMRPLGEHQGGWYPPWWERYRTLSLVSTNLEFTFQSDGTGLALGALFRFIRQKYELRALCEPPFTGSLHDAGGGSYLEWYERLWEQDARVLSASPVPGFEFAGWKSQDGSVVMSETNAFLVASNCTWTAQFSPTCAVAVLRLEWESPYGLKSIARIARQVQTLVVPPGTNVVLTVFEPRYGFNPRGRPMISKWTRTGKRIAEQAETLALSNVTRRDSGLYRFVFQMDGKKFTSSMVRLRVIQPKRQ